MAYKFKVGDRVRLKDLRAFEDMEEFDARMGQVGTVLQISTVPWVVFDEPTGFPGLPGLLGEKNLHMDCVSQERLELLPEDTDVPDPS